jgi:geranylgeranyl reductase family protein
MSYDVVIVGAGPGGLACAERTARLGLNTLVLERQETIGKKVCGGGITWNGLLKRVPDALHEKVFKKQFIYTRYQKTCVSSSTPIIATVNREKLGLHMEQKARQAGAEIRLGCHVTSIEGTTRLSYVEKSKSKKYQENFTYLIGADGSSSMVRRHIGLPALTAGVGINYQIPGQLSDMQWHLDSSLFSSGYSWVFPHENSVSIGAYVDQKTLKASTLNKNLLIWAKRKGFLLENVQPKAGFINYDFKGYQFGNIFLIGDAAGLASGLTGEGIYSAIVSGETVANLILDPSFHCIELTKIIKNHAFHKKMVAFAGKNNILATILFELLTVALKTKILNFSAVEMSRQ